MIWPCAFSLGQRSYLSGFPWVLKILMTVLSQLISNTGLPTGNSFPPPEIFPMGCQIIILGPRLTLLTSAAASWDFTNVRETAVLQAFCEKVASILWVHSSPFFLSICIIIEVSNHKPRARKRAAKINHLSPKSILELRVWAKVDKGDQPWRMTRLINPGVNELFSWSLHSQFEVLLIPKKAEPPSIRRKSEVMRKLSNSIRLPEC